MPRSSTRWTWRPLTLTPPRGTRCEKRRLRGACSLASHRSSLAILRQLTATEPTRTDWQEALACCLKSIGDVLETMGALQEALSHHKQCVDIWRTLIARGRGDRALRSHVAYTVEEIAQIQHGLGDLPQALLLRKG